MIKLITHLFSLKRGNMRAIRLYRIRQVCWLIPFFTFLLITNNIALALDWILFPKFKSKEVINPVFIVSLPRTGTTNLFHGLNFPGSPFTSMSLWEILLAPSVVQKKVYRTCWKLSPAMVKNAIKKTDKTIFKKLNVIHKSGLFKKEEDEIVLMWSLSSAYLSFFYPESTVLRDLFRFDMELTEYRKKKIMRNYYRLIQRHLYALGKNSEKCFLSKNPSMASKIESISTYFPDAKTIVIDRDPRAVFPSTVILQKQLFQFATNVPTSAEERMVIMDILESFRANLQISLAEKKVLPCIVISFDDLIKDRDETILTLMRWLGYGAIEPIADNIEHKTKAQYTPLKSDELQKILHNPWPSWPKDMFLSIG